MHQLVSLVMTMNADLITTTLRAGFGAETSVRARRPNLFQIHLPAYFLDGDAAHIYVRPADDGMLEVSDLGHTLMRLTYTQKMSTKLEDSLERLARPHGFALREGSLVAMVKPDALLAASFGLAQLESQAEVTIVARAVRGVRAEKFKDLVREDLKRAFLDKVQFDYFDKKGDPEGVYKLDALITGGRTLGVAIVGGDIDAESAVNTKLHMVASMTNPRFAAVMRDVEELRAVTRKKLMKEYLAAVPAFEDEREAVPGKLRDLADAA